MPVTGLDHFALPTDDAERLLAFYEALGFGTHHVEEWRAGTRPMFSIALGPRQKLNVHPEALKPVRGNPAYLRGDTAEAGCGDFCVVWEGGVEALLRTLAAAGVVPVEGPVPRHGGRDLPGVSVYVRDPDRNLLELISYDPADIAAYGADDTAL